MKPVRFYFVGFPMQGLRGCTRRGGVLAAESGNMRLSCGDDRIAGGIWKDRFSSLRATILLCLRFTRQRQDEMS